MLEFDPWGQAENTAKRTLRPPNRKRKLLMGVFTGVSLHGGLVLSGPPSCLTAQIATGRKGIQED